MAATGSGMIELKGWVSEEQYRGVIVGVVEEIVAECSKHAPCSLGGLVSTVLREEAISVPDTTEFLVSLDYTGGEYEDASGEVKGKLNGYWARFQCPWSDKHEYRVERLREELDYLKDEMVRGWKKHVPAGPVPENLLDAGATACSTVG